MPQDTDCHKSSTNARATLPKGLVALGANIPSSAGSPAETLAAALDRLSDSPLEVVAISRFYRTPCFPEGAGPDYVNAAAELRGSADAHEILQLLHDIEADFGRERALRWGMRTLDLDLIGLGDLVLPDLATWRQWRDMAPELQHKAVPDRLILPHPRLQDRGFVLVPLCDVAPDWAHPVTGQTVAQMAAALPAAERSSITPL